VSICARQSVLERYSATTSWLNELGERIADSAARMSFSRIACGASAHPTRNPGARVLEKERTQRVGGRFVEVKQAVGIVFEYQDLAGTADLEDFGPAFG
jgi:hypothetical protein